MAEMSFFSPKQLVLVETGCKNKDCVHVFSYALKGIAPVRIRQLIRRGRVSCVVALAHDGVVAVETTTNTMDSALFFDFVRGSLLPNMLPLMVVIHGQFASWTTAPSTT